MRRGNVEARGVTRRGDEGAKAGRAPRQRRDQSGIALRGSMVVTTGPRVVVT
jgi:hypothetical protein